MAPSSNLRSRTPTVHGGAGIHNAASEHQTSWQVAVLYTG